MERDRLARERAHASYTLRQQNKEIATMEHELRKTPGDDDNRHQAPLPPGLTLRKAAPMEEELYGMRFTIYYLTAQR